MCGYLYLIRQQALPQSSCICSSCFSVFVVLVSVVYSVLELGSRRAHVLGLDALSLEVHASRHGLAHLPIVACNGCAFWSAVTHWPDRDAFHANFRYFGVALPDGSQAMWPTSLLFTRETVFAEHQRLDNFFVTSSSQLCCAFIYSATAGSTPACSSGIRIGVSRRSYVWFMLQVFVGELVNYVVENCRCWVDAIGREEDMV